MKPEIKTWRSMFIIFKWRSTILTNIWEEGRRSELKLWGIGSTWEQLPTINHGYTTKIFYGKHLIKSATFTNYSFIKVLSGTEISRVSTCKIPGKICRRRNRVGAAPKVVVSQHDFRWELLPLWLLEVNMSIVLFPILGIIKNHGQES